MAKRQNLSLNPSKISGQCGRLLCCLAYEDEGYKKRRPKPSQGVSLPVVSA
jgi:cell fate regulator YaaT (PSP1 superfamily)